MDSPFLDHAPSWVTGHRGRDHQGIRWPVRRRLAALRVIRVADRPGGQTVLVRVQLALLGWSLIRLFEASWSTPPARTRAPRSLLPSGQV